MLTLSRQQQAYHYVLFLTKQWISQPIQSDSISRTETQAFHVINKGLNKSHMLQTIGQAALA